MKNLPTSNRENTNETKTKNTFIALDLFSDRLRDFLAVLDTSRFVPHGN